jgi:hypothetical protein
VVDKDDAACTAAKACCICKANYQFDTAGDGTCKAIPPKCPGGANACVAKKDSEANKGCPDTATFSNDYTCTTNGQICCIPKPQPKICDTDLHGTCSDQANCETGKTKADPSGLEDCKKKTPPKAACCVPLPDCKSALSGECIAKADAATKCTGDKKTISDTTGCAAGTEVCCAVPKKAGDETPTTPDTAPAPGDDSSLPGKIFNAGLALFTVCIGLIINFMSWLAGKLLIQEMEIVIFLSGYNNFIRNTYVSQGWIVLRDLVNMFFVLGLLFIAFITVLRIERQPWNKLLGKLLLMAILVNFSKTICGVIIDFFRF